MKGFSMRAPGRDRGKLRPPAVKRAFGPVLLLLFLALPLGLSFAGCSFLQPVAQPTGPSEFEMGLARLAHGDFVGADSSFRELASRCESGTDGRKALLFLSFLALDPRNPAAHPDSAALMAQRFLNLPGKTLEGTLEAEALYVTALDHGADPGLRIDPADPGFAVRFGDCDAPFPSRTVRPLPILEGSTLGRLRMLGEERDSLVQRNQQLRYTVGRLRFLSDSLQAQVDTLQAELDRIRQLIRLPDTSVVRPQPDTGLVLPPDTGLGLPPDTGLVLPPDMGLGLPPDTGHVFPPADGWVPRPALGSVLLPYPDLFRP
jgi:hypothetical protein